MGEMGISDARLFRDVTVDLTWTDRQGNAQTKTTHVLAVEFVPLYGPCLVTTEGEIRLDRVVSCQANAQLAA
jgi:hypothetical protein